MKQYKFLKVTFEYEDRYESLEGRVARDWLTEVNDKILMNANDGIFLKSRKWKVFKKF